VSEFRFGELRERSLHRQLKAFYCPEDGEAEWPLGQAIADLWSPTVGVIEIQTRTLAKLRPKLAAYLEAGLSVTVVHPLSKQKTIATWNSDRTELLRQRKSPKSERLEASFREIGSLWEHLVHPRFRLVLTHIQETEHRAEDGLGSWRRQGRSRVDRVLDRVLGETVLARREDYAALVPSSWNEPDTASTLARALDLAPREAQPLISCLKKLGVLEVCGKSGRSLLLRRSTS
jgi:hypothetical protein